jgi:hypothetical protein
MKVIDLKLSDKIYLVDNYSFDVVELMIYSISKRKIDGFPNGIIDVYTAKNYHFEFSGPTCTHSAAYRGFTTYKEALEQVEKNKQKKLAQLEAEQKEIEEKIKKFKDDYRN